MIGVKGKIAVGLIVIISFFFLIIGLALDASNVKGANNQSVATKVNITNNPPSLYDVVINPTPIDLNPGSTTPVNCTGFVYDLNGWDDISNVNATLYDITYGDGSTFDNNYRYQNSSCVSDCQSYLGSSTNGTCTCTFDVQYYANNGSWACNMTISDGFGLADTANSSSYPLSPIVAIDVPPELHYGNLSVTQISKNMTLNVTNFGNTPINISVRGYGGNNDTLPGAGLSTMICSTNNITIGYQRYSTNSSTIFNEMINLTNSSSNLNNFDIPQRRDDNNVGNSTNSTYWRLEIPSNVGGFCNGTIEFSATQAN